MRANPLPQRATSSRLSFTSPSASSIKPSEGNYSARIHQSQDDVITEMERIQRGIAERNVIYYGDKLKFYAATLERWFRELTRPTLRHSDTPDRLRRKALLLLQEDLYPFTPTPARYLPLLRRYL